ncbi:MAG: DUF2674 domain-containing protein [Candidatus Rickettsia vulgarisii]
MTEAEKKVISFSVDRNEMDEINKSIEAGWAIVKLVPCGNRYIGLMEKHHHNSKNDKEHVVYIPPKKKIVIK